MGRKLRQVVYMCSVGLAAVAGALGLAFIAARILHSPGRGAIELTCLMLGALFLGVVAAAIVMRMSGAGSGGSGRAQPRYRRLARSNFVGIVLSDTSGTIIKANDAFARMSGYPLEQFHARQITWDRLSDSARPVIDETSSQQLSAEGVFEPTEAAIRRADGSQMAVMIGGTAMDDPPGAVGCFVLDISRIKEAEAVVRGHRDELERVVRTRTAELSTAHQAATFSRDLLRAVIEGIGDVVFLKDTDGRYQMINEAGARVFGRRVDEIVGRNDIELFGAGPGQAIMERDRALLHQQQEATFDQDLPTALNGVRTFLTTKGPHRDPSGKIVGIIGIARDITERKLAERATRDASAAKDRFLAILSHELRTPLMPVLATASTIEADPKIPQSIRDDARLIRRNVEIEARLIDDLLDVTRISKGKLELKPETVDLHRVVEEVIQVCRPEVDARQLRLVSSLHATRRHVRGDPARLRQILWNLIRNAAKFTPPGGQITVECVNGDDPSTIRMVVTDTGIGIGPQTMSRIFGAFEQGDPGITRRFGGLGLGLMLSKAFTEAHGGRLRAHSDGPGRGASFSSELPTCPDPTEIAVAPAAGEVAAIPELCVLVVDDHADTAGVIARVLRVLGCKPRITGTIAAATQLILAGGIDAVISDIHLPDGSGRDLARLLTPLKIPAVALSGSGMHQDILDSIEAGFLDHLVKPVTFEQLESVIRKIASQREGMAAAVSA